MAMTTSPHPKNNPNITALSPLSVNLHHHPAKRQEPVDLFSPKGRPIRRRHSVPHRRSDASRAVPKTPFPSPIHPNKNKLSSTQSSVTNKTVVPIMLRLRRMKRRLLHEHTKDHQEVVTTSPTNRNL